MAPAPNLPPGEPAAKRALRARLLRERTPVDAPATELLHERFLALPEVLSATCAAAYVGGLGEVPTLAVCEALVARGVRVVLPILAPDGDLAWGDFTGPETLIIGRYGLREPAAAGAALADAGVVLAPGVAFDAAGHRLGRGGGAYDRALIGVDVPVIGLAVDAWVLDDLPVEPHDRPVDVVVTPTRLLRCPPG